MFLVFFIFTFFLLYLVAILFSHIRISLHNVRKSNYDKEWIEENNKNLSLQIEFYFLDKIKILGKTIKKQKIDKMIEKAKKQDFEIKKIKKYVPSNKALLKSIKHLKVKIDKFELVLYVGTEDVVITSGIVVLLSSILAWLFPFVVNKNKKKDIYYKIMPIYEQTNQYKIKFNCIINIKLVHIIYMMYQLVKERKIDKDGKSSNRRTYEYSYEQH